jgi:HlyD family secretion protein
MAQEEPKRSRVWLWVLVTLVLAVGLFSYFKLNRTMVAVRTALVERADITSEVSTNGKVEPSNDFQAHAPLPGVVERLFVVEGQQVKAGQQLVKMDDSDARKQIASAEANVVSSNSTLTAMEHGGTQDEQLTARADLQTAKAQVAQDAETLATLKKLQSQGASSANEVAVAQRKLADAQAGVDIRAPFAGTVYAVPVSQYDFVQAGETLLDVADLTKLQVQAYFDEPEIGALRIGQPVKIIWDAKPTRVWHGHIIEAPTTIISYGTRNVGECLLSVDDANGDLLPNTNVTVTVTTARRDSVLSLPREALHTDGTSNFVYKIVNGRLVKTPIQLGAGINLTRFEIASGLKQGDVIALSAAPDTDLADGLRIKEKP